MQPTAVPESVGLSAGRLARIRPWMRGYVEAGKLPGASVLVARSGELVWVATTGYSDVERERRLTSDDLMRFYSMTKPVTSVAAMMLYEQGRFQLDDEVSRFVPAPARHAGPRLGGGRRDVQRARAPAHHHPPAPYPLRRIHVRTRQRSSGIAPLPGPAHRLLPHGRALEEVVSRLARLPLVHHPGERWNYGVATDVLGRVVEVVSGQRLDRFFAEHILGPLGMHDTGFQVAPEKRGRLARLYGPSKTGGLTPLEPSGVSPYFGDVTTFSGGAGLVSTLGDYFRFTEMLRRGESSTGSASSGARRWST